MERTIAYIGEQRTIAYAIDSSGEFPGLKFFEGLDVRDKAKILKLFEIVGDRGRANKEKFKIIEGTRFYEFKSKQIRMPCYQVSAMWIITHGFRKKTDKIDPAEIRRAERIKNEDELYFLKSSKKS